MVKPRDPKFRQSLEIAMEFGFLQIDWEALALRSIRVHFEKAIEIVVPRNHDPVFFTLPDKPPQVSAHLAPLIR